jgi:transposase-like protein
VPGVGVRAETSAHFAEIYGASVSKETISRITDTVVAEMHDWAARPPGPVYVAVFIDGHPGEGLGRPSDIRQP